MLRLISAALTMLIGLHATSANAPTDGYSDAFLEFVVNGTTFRYSELQAVQTLDRSDRSLRVTIGAARDLFEKGARYAIYWTTTADNPPQPGIVTSPIHLWLDLPDSNQAVVSLLPTSAVLVTLTSVTEDVIAGTFSGENLQLVTTSERKVAPDVYSVSGQFRATRLVLEHDG